VSERAEFREGRRLRADDLNREAASRRADLDDHLALAHPARGADHGLIGAAVTAPAEDTAIELLHIGPSTAVRMALPGTGEALRLAPGEAGHRAAGRVTGRGAPMAAKGALRLVSAAGPAAGPAPWTVRALDQRDDQGRLTGRELRIELEVPAGSSSVDSRVAVGPPPGAAVNAPFRPVFVVDAGGAVTIAGDVLVGGVVSQGTVPADPDDPRFVAAVIDLVAQRIVGVATAATTPAFTPTRTRDPASTPASTRLIVKLTPHRNLTDWGAALEISRLGERHYQLLAIGSAATAGQPITRTRDLPWDPPLTAATAATVVVAVAALDAQGQMAARRLTIVLTA